MWSVVATAAACAYAESKVGMKRYSASYATFKGKPDHSHPAKCLSCGSHEFRLHNGVSQCSFCRTPGGKRNDP